MISSVLLARLRALEESVMPDTYEVIRETHTDTTEAGYTTAEATASAGICRLRGLGSSAQERQIAERRQWDVAYSIRLPLAADVTPDDRIRVNGTRTFEVGGVVRTGTYATAQTAVCREQGP